MIEGKCCALCHWFDGRSEDDYGLCDLRPPIPVVVGDEVNWLRPEVSPADRCRDWLSQDVTTVKQ